MPEPAVPEVHDADLQRVVDEELSRLPDHYRGVVVLCDLEGMTRKQAARQLGIPEGSVAKRLNQRGIVFSGWSVAAVLLAGSAPPALVASTIRAASLLTAGQAAGFVSAKVAALTEGVVKTMFVSKIKTALAVVLILGLVATGATLLTYRSAAGQDDKKPTVEKPVEQAAKQRKEKVTAWGKEVDGVQVGIQFGEDRVYKIGETVTLIVRLRNNGKKDVPFFYHEEHFQKYPPLITDADGKAAIIRERNIFGIIKKSSCASGKEVDLCILTLDLRPATDRKKEECWTLYGTGKFLIQYQDVPVAGEPQLEAPVTAHATGKLELEVRESR
jgi:hypothetical protein